MEIEEYRWIAVRAEQKPYPPIGFVRVPRAKAGPIYMSRKNGAVGRLFKMGFLSETTKLLGGWSELAILSDGSGLEFWRDVPDFVEAVA